jgi:hypothetical protein
MAAETPQTNDTPETNETPEKTEVSVPAPDDATVVEEASAPKPEVIIVDAPVAPRPKGNRGAALALSLLVTVVYVAVLVGLALVIPALSGGAIVDPTFYYPVLVFFIAELLVTIALNRAGWWSHIIGSAVVGLVVWLGSASLVLVSAGMFSMNQTEANDAFFAALFSPILIVAALLGREVSIWTGAILARRGRRLKVVNAEAHAAFEREQAELIPTA